LKGKVRISGSKNSALPILAASLLTEETCEINDVPPLTDVSVMQNLIEDFGGKTVWDAKKEKMSISAERITKTDACFELVSSMRASFLVMGPLLARMGQVKAALPGGCTIGARPVDLHLKGFAAMGAEIELEHGFVCAKAKRLRGANVYLDFPSVGATENILMAATLAEGQTIIQNCAVEPEIVDLANFLASIGADIRGAGTGTIRINGVKRLSGGCHTIIPDRIEAGTFMLAAATTKGDVLVENAVSDHLKPITAKLREANVTVEEDEEGIRVGASKAAKPIDLKTLPYPGFPTDMQAQFMGFLSTVEGSSIVIETIFENRFMHIPELVRMGAKIRIDSRSAIIEGAAKLNGAAVKATDLRAGAALVICALTATGTTEVHDIYHIDRGYSGFDEKLRQLGGRIIRVEG
jgi:UDP-N-acetylglucosamine 1-carboxyvinyltransferase